MLYQYNNIYTSLHKYLKGKQKKKHTHTHTQKHKPITGKKKKNVAIVDCSYCSKLGEKKVAHETTKHFFF